MVSEAPEGSPTRGNGQQGDSRGKEKIIHYLFSLAQNIPVKNFSADKEKLNPKLFQLFPGHSPGTDDGGVDCTSKKSVQSPRSCDSQQAQGLFEEAATCTSQHRPPLLAPLEIITPKWPIISASMIFFSHLLKAFPFAHFYFFFCF